MQSNITNLQRLSGQKFLLFSLIGIGLIVIGANIVGQEFSILVGNYLYIPITGAFAILAISTSIKFGLTGKHGKAWLLFSIFASSWLIAEMTWLYLEIVLEIDPYPSIADFFWFLGYPFLFFFSIFYLYPVKSAISKKILLSSIGVSLALLIPMLYVTSTLEDSSAEFIEIALAAGYPIADAIVLVPALIGVGLFFKGKVNFLWTLILLGILSQVVADTLFFITELNETYFTGHPMETVFFWSYILFSFGLYNHLKIFRKNSEN